ncbi:MAG TPA: hypothetical protein VMG39_12515 [Pseudolabrys sp.]|nr:hypothetical protein [Pseudolabrys sp.]
MRTIISLTAFFALTLTAANAAEWCGFIDKDHAPVHCGYSSLAECKQSVGDKKDGYCMPDPGFASREDGRIKVASRTDE